MYTTYKRNLKVIEEIVDNEVIVLAAVEQYPSTSIRRISRDSGLFTEENLIAEMYLDLFVNQICPAIEAVTGENELIWFQHDGAPAQSSVTVTEFLNA